MSKLFTLFHNCDVYTDAQTFVSPGAILLEKNLIKLAESEEKVRKFASQIPDRMIETIDLCGGTVVPGLVDSHTHFAAYCESKLGVDLTGTESKTDILYIIRDHCTNIAPGTWIRGWGWNKNLWDEDDFPHRFDLDPVTAGHPTVLTSQDGHALWLNTEAVSQLGLSAKTNEPGGGRIIKDNSGKLSGVFLEAAMDLVKQHLPPVPTEDLKGAIVEEQANAHALGLTGLVSCEGRDALSAFSQLNVDGNLTLRVRMTLPNAVMDCAEQIGLSPYFGDEMLQISAVKIFLDGAIGSQTAYMQSPYCHRDDSYRGIILLSEKQLAQIVHRSWSLGFPVAIHAIGDAANHMALDVLQKQKDDESLRNRIEHAQLLSEEDIPRFSNMDIVASMQPSHLLADRDLVDHYWGQRGKGAYAFASLKEAGVTLAFGSDLPVDSLDPLKGIRAAVTRDDGRGKPWYPRQRLSPHEALKAYTAGAAYGLAEEHVRGELSCGKLADFAVFDTNFIKNPSADCTTVITVVDGKIVHDVRP